MLVRLPPRRQMENLTPPWGGGRLSPSPPAGSLYNVDHLPSLSSRWVIVYHGSIDVNSSISISLWHKVPNMMDLCDTKVVWLRSAGGTNGILTCMDLFTIAELILL